MDRQVATLRLDEPRSVGGVLLVADGLPQVGMNLSQYAERHKRGEQFHAVSPLGRSRDIHSQPPWRCFSCY